MNKKLARIFNLLLPLVAISFSATATEELSPEQCQEIGGKYTNIGCILESEDIPNDMDYESAYMPNKEQCECQGNIWREAIGCTPNITADECTSMGGTISSEYGCVIKPTEETCQAMGGEFNDDGDCKINQSSTELLR